MLTLKKDVRPWLADPARDPRRYDEYCFACLNLDVVVIRASFGARDGLDCHTWDSWTFETTFWDVRQAKDDGCPTCTILYSSLSEFPPELPWEDEEEAFWVSVEEGNVCRVWYGASRERCVEIFTMPGENSPWPVLGTKMTLSGDGEPWVGGSVQQVPISAGAPECLQTIKDWLKDCSLGHKCCNSAAKAPLPKRVIHVGTVQGYGDIRLVESCPDDERYVALSHCWGKSRHLITEKSSISSRKANIPWDEFPKTFQDAIILTRYLGIPYIWIDSLCIIQDDKNDWQIEAAKMCTIYQGAYLVIAATCSSDGDGGCFTERSRTHTINGTDHNRNVFKVYARQRINHATFRWGTAEIQNIDRRDGAYEPPDFNLSTDPLLSRAWCYQERLLATRILQFTQAEMVWECLTCTRCECGQMSHFCSDPMLRTRRIAARLPEQTIPTAEDEARWLHILDEYLTTSVRDLTREEKQRQSDFFLHRSDKLRRRDDDAIFLFEKFSLMKRNPVDKILQHWRQVISAYSDRMISFDTDTLPALAGLARSFSGYDLGRYFAGHWEKDLCRSMMWVARGLERKQKDEYLAPTWSWASTRRRIDWVQSDGDQMQWHTKVLDVMCQPLGLDPFGQISSGFCKVEGPLVKVEAINEPRDHGLGVWKVHVMLNDREAVVDIDRPANCQTGLDRLWCLRFCTVCYGLTGGHFHSRYDKALVLRKRNETQFERFGFVQCHPDMWTGNELFTECLIV